MAISEYYFPILKKLLHKQNVPLEIKYLAACKIGLNPKAVSRVGSKWFVAVYVSNRKQYNLNIDSYVDERSDPLKASEAVAQA